MKTQFLAFLSFAVGVSILATTTFGSATTNAVFTINQKGETSHPNALATTADMAALKAATITAEEHAKAASASARHGTNMMWNIAADIGRNELVIYSYGYTDGFSAAFTFDPDAKIIFHDFRPLNERNDDGLLAFRLGYALKNSTEFQGQPIVRWRSALDDGKDYVLIDEANIEPAIKLPEEYIDSDGIVYQHKYEVRFWNKQEKQGFYKVELLPDDAAGDGMVMELPNGIKGGFTGFFIWGQYKLEIVGGIIVGVSDV